MDIESLWERARIIRRVREFFDRKKYLEADTPLLSPNLIPETCLEVFETAYLAPEGSRRPKQPLWLVPSPEIWMKKLIARHRINMYQIGKCFRNGESLGRLHSPEFTMLEYYTVDADYRDSLILTEELFAFLTGPRQGGSGKPSGGRDGRAGGADIPAGARGWSGGGARKKVRAPDKGGERGPPFTSSFFTRLTMAEAFSRWAGFDLYEAAEKGALNDEARKLGLDPPPGLDAAALYDLIFVHAVEPRLPRDRPVVIMDYPAFVPCLAKKSPGGKTVERWELYCGGVELANCYSEETEPEAVRRYFALEGDAKNREGLVPHAIDGDYWKIFLPQKDEAGLERPFPRCSGVALGLDRLIMVLTGRSTIDGALPFPME
jgi:lysyl-tRNA synthetase class 2